MNSPIFPSLDDIYCTVMAVPIVGYEELLDTNFLKKNRKRERRKTKKRRKDIKGKKGKKRKKGERQQFIVKLWQKSLFLTV